MVRRQYAVPTRNQDYGTTYRPKRLRLTSVADNFTHAHPRIRLNIPPTSSCLEVDNSPREEQPEDEALDWPAAVEAVELVQLPCHSTPGCGSTLASTTGTGSVDVL